jgi:hypothetical protein
MATFTKPENLNGAELKQELTAVNIKVNLVKDNLDGTISFETDNQTLAAEIVAKHNGTTIAPDSTIENKLASVNLSLAELKDALGL